MKQTDPAPTTPSAVAEAMADKPAASDAISPAEAPPEHNPPDYNPEDYRWVPVRRRPRYDGWTDEKQRRFIEVLADTGIVSLAAKEVGMSREGAYRLRRSPHGIAFARAWDVARERAGALLEDIAFERAIEGVEQNTYNNAGELVNSRIVYNDRLLCYLLGHLKPERYGRAAQRAGVQPGGAQQTVDTPPPKDTQIEARDTEPDSPSLPEPPEAPPAVAREIELDETLRAMEPTPPAPPEDMLDRETLAHELDLADDMDGVLPHFFKEQRQPKSPERIAAEEAAAQDARGKAACEKMDRGEELSDEEFEDMSLHLDPSQRNIRTKTRGKAGRAR